MVISKTLLCAVCISFLINLGFAQDIHHSQFYTSPLNVNPANTGVFNGDHRVALNYRRQWFVDEIVKYMTFTGSFDMRFYPKRWDRKGMWNAGILFNYDKAGDSRLSLGHIGLTISYAYPLNTNNIISIGGSIGGSQRKFNQDDLKWDAQYDGNDFDPDRFSNEDFSNLDNAFLDLSGGLNYRWQKTSRTKIDLGVSAMHLNRPDQKFFSNSKDVKLPIRLNINATPSFQIVEKVDLLLHGQYQIQKPYTEFLAGLYGKLYVNQKRGKELAILLGVASRFNDAIIPKIALEYNNWYAGFSYDINTSPFKVATVNRGGPEFSLIYINTKARPLSQLKACPIF